MQTTLVKCFEVHHSTIPRPFRLTFCGKKQTKLWAPPQKALHYLPSPHAA